MVLRNNIESDLVQVEQPVRRDGDIMAEDVQSGQDIIIKIKNREAWEDVYYVEVKSKWDFSEPAHMSARQIRNAVLHPNNYALCCVDLRSYKNNDLLNLSEQTILNNTRVKMDIGKELANMMQDIIRADDKSDDIQIKISDYRSNISAKVFEVGEPICNLIECIENKIKKLTAL